MVTVSLDHEICHKAIHPSLHPSIHLLTASPLLTCRAATTHSGPIGPNPAEVKGSALRALCTLINEAQMQIAV